VVLAALALVGACSGDGGEEGAVSSSSSTTAAPEFTGDPASPFCEELRTLDVEAVLGPQASTPAEVRDGFARLIEVLDGLTELAPQDIRPDVELVAGGIRALDEVLAEIGHDFAALPETPYAQEVLEASNDPVYVGAGDRLDAYRSQVCAL
jgi:hypothetical protein